MRKLFLVALLSLSFVGLVPAGERSTDPKQSYYYFCLSREVLVDEESATKRQLVYTDIHEITGDENDIHQLSKRFADFIHGGCKPGNELCTSDLNYYPDLQQAEKRKKELLTKFENTGKYDIKRIDFKFD